LNAIQGIIFHWIGGGKKHIVACKQRLEEVHLFFSTPDHEILKLDKLFHFQVAFLIECNPISN